MNLFAKKLPKEAKQGIVKIALLILGIGVFITMPLIASLGWFASNYSAGANGMQVVVSGSNYDILIDRPAPGNEQFDPEDEDSDGNLVYPNIEDLTAQLTAEEYDLTETDTARASSLAFELIVDSGGHGSSDKNLMPGSYGRLEFYLRPGTGAEGTTATLSLSIEGYCVQYRQVNEEDVAYAAPVEDAAVQALLRGHILFFTGYDDVNDRYSGLITNGTFEYVMGSPNTLCDPPKDDCYKVTLYWEWPITFEEILEETSTTSPAAVAKKYPAALAAYWNANRTCFFATNAQSENATQLSDGYNDGDQLIADEIDFLVIRVH